MDRPIVRTPGRAAASNPANRYDRLRSETEDEAFGYDDELPVLRTEVSEEVPRRVLTFNSSPDLPFDRSVNAYRGCEHGCIYCFARPSHAYLGLSPGLDFETRLIARPDAARILRKELASKSYRVAPIAMGTNTDPYQPVEGRYAITRSLLELMAETRHPVGIVTKGRLILRDIDLLAGLAEQGLVRVGVSMTTLDADLSRRMEPRAPAPAMRLRMIRTLTEAGIPVRVMTSPLVPGLTDHELERMLEAAAEAGAVAASWIMLRLPLEVSPLFRDWLAEHYPDRAARVMARVREMHGGRDYSAEWGKRMRGEGHYAGIIAQRFKAAARRLGLDRPQPELRCDLFRAPRLDTRQGDLFGDPC
ncbi:DNA repair photolyase [Oceanicola sp. 22II-s10i]|uniref:PA0069 family radical SAM protein n=1 Tax=Oceanicola sp. 22II-s10i TaxID=1317116 RepID=UPI000B524016|nr:PA0069 family radical SAM protein [Oceanicola sp. 22II-s10i]OWU83428.1 DNA repair photolyase [Oceanicola sp. 22II-s10i]